MLHSKFGMDRRNVKLLRDLMVLHTPVLVVFGLRCFPNDLSTRFVSLGTETHDS